MWRKADTKSDFRDGHARKGGPGGPIVDEDAGNVTLSGRPEAEMEGLKRAACIWPPIGGSKGGHVFVTS